MLSMEPFVVDLVTQRMSDVGDIDADDIDPLTHVFRRPALTIGAIVAYMYDDAVHEVLYNVADMAPALLTRLGN